MAGAATRVSSAPVRRLLAWADLVDRTNRTIGRAVGWMVLVMVVLGAWNAVGRYLGRFLGRNLSANALIESQWYLFSLVFLLGAADALSRDRHVRVDVLYGKLGARGRAWIDLLGTIFFLLPFTVGLAVVSWPSIASSWRLHESSPDPGGLPRYPIKTAILVACVLLFLQGLVIVVRKVDELRRLRAEEHR